MKHAATLNVNGMAYPVELEGDATLLDAIREDIGLTGTKTGCDDCECGACMVMVDGRPVNSCTYLALQAQGSEITTVEGLADGDELSAIQSAFLDQGGVQCGYCTPGMLVSAHALLRHNPDPSEEEIRLALSGNLKSAVFRQIWIRIQICRSLAHLDPDPNLHVVDVFGPGSRNVGGRLKP
jgi:carbon-monoxide dehydrogenase small subunit